MPKSLTHLSRFKAFILIGAFILTFLLAVPSVWAKRPPETRNQDDLNITQDMHGQDLNGYEFVNLTKSNSGPNFIARTSRNNGVVGKVSETKVKPFEAGLLTVSLGGSVLETFLQDEPFYTAFHIFVLKPKKQMLNLEKIYYCAAINLNKYRYNYGRQANRTLENLEVPEFNTKDFFFIASFILKIGFFSKYVILAFLTAFLAKEIVLAATAKIG